MPSSTSLTGGSVSLTIGSAETSIQAQPSNVRTALRRIGSLYSLRTPIPTSTASRRVAPYSGDSVIITPMTIQNDAFVPNNPNGINNFRPEIIATTDFMPIWEPTVFTIETGIFKNLSPVGELINFQYQTKQLRQETLQGLIANVKNTIGSSELNQAVSDFKKELNSLNTSLTFINTIIQNINLINDSLDIKYIPDNNYVAIKNGINTPIPSLQQFAINNLQYNITQYENFSETKILLQLLFDFKNTLTDYSYGLLSITDNDRAIDANITAIDKTSNINDGFNFQIKNFAASSELLNALEIYQRFIRSLPAQPDSVIKLLTYVLAKEFIIATNIGSEQNRDIITKFGVESSIATTTDVPQKNIFTNIIGDVGDTIFQKPINQYADTLVNILYINPLLGRQYLVLPFENRYVVSNDNQSVYIPGNSYFTDAIIKTDNSNWNIKPYTDYVSRFNTVFSQTKSAIERLYNLTSYSAQDINTSNSSYSPTVPIMMQPTGLYQKIIEKFQISFDKISAEEYSALSSNLNNQKELEIAILNVLRLAGEIAKNQRDLAARLTNARADEFEQTYIDLDIATIGRLLEELKTESALLQRLSAENQFNEEYDKLSSKQAFIMALYKKAGNNLPYRKILYELATLRGIWKNAQNTNNKSFFYYLTATEFKTLNDIITKNRDMSHIEIPSFGVSMGAVITDLSFSDINIATLQTAIAYEIQRITRYIKNDLKRGYRYPRTRSTRADTETTDALFTSILLDDENAFRDFLSDPLSPPSAQNNSLFDILYACVFDNTPDVANTLLAQSVDLMEYIFETTRQNEQVVYILNNGKTKFNGINLSVQFMFLQEIFFQLAKKYSTLELKGIIAKDEQLTANDIANIENSIADIEDLQNWIITEGYEIQYNTDSRYNNYDSKINARRNTGKYYIAIKVDLAQQDQLQNVFDMIKNGKPDAPGNMANPMQNTALYGDLYDIYEKIDSEIKYIQNVLDIIGVINTRLSNASNTIGTFFRQTALSTFLRDSPINNLDIIKNLSQYRLSNLIYQDLKERVVYSDSLITLPGGPQVNVSFEENDLIISDALIPSEYNAMVSMLSENTDTNQVVPNAEILDETIQRNNKILTIGIPAGLSQQLADRVTINQFNRQGAVGKQSDIINVNICPSDMRFGEVVLKPINYIVDLSLFLTKKDFYDLNANNGELFSNLISRIKVSDLSNPTDIKKYGIANIINNARYSFLTNEQKRSMHEMLVRSYLYGLYINCLTGIKYSEDVFLDTDLERVLNPNIVTALNRYVKNAFLETVEGYTTTEEILANTEYSEKLKDAYRLMTYGNVAYNRNEATRRINSPKIFDRVYHFPINFGRLEVDIVATNQTEAGRLSLEKPSIQKYLSRNADGTKFYLNSIEPNDLVIKDVFFMTLTNDTGTGTGLYWSPPSVASTRTSDAEVRIG